MKFSKRNMDKWIKDAKAYATKSWTFINVTECTYCCLNNKKNGLINFKKEVNTFCHAGVSHCAEVGGSTVGEVVPFMVDNICYNNGSYGTKKQQIRFLQYVMNHPILGQSFIEHDAEKALEEHMMIRDLSKLPSNVMMFCLILTRALWESYQSKVIPRFCELVNRGFNPDDALVLAHFVEPSQNDTLKYSPIISTGHNAIDYATSTVGYLKNYHHHKIVTTSPGTILEGFGTNGKGFNVFSIFMRGEVDDYGFGGVKAIKGDPPLSVWVKEHINNLLEATNDLTGGKL